MIMHLQSGFKKNGNYWGAGIGMEVVSFGRKMISEKIYIKNDMDSVKMLHYCYKHLFKKIEGVGEKMQILLQIFRCFTFFRNTR